MTASQQRILELIQTSTKKKTIFMVLGGISGLVMGPGLIVFSRTMPELFGDNPDAARYGMYFGIFITFVLLLMPAEELVKHYRRKQVEKAVTGDKGDILWIYKEVSNAAVSATRATKGAAYATYHRIVFGHRKGFLVPIQPGNKNVPELEKLVQEEFPHATFGYHWDLSRQFKKNPEAAMEYKTKVDMSHTLTKTVKASGI